MKAYEALVSIATAYGAKRPVWKGDEPIVSCWIDRAEWLLKVARDGLDTTAAVEEVDRYSGRM